MLSICTDSNLKLYEIGETTRDLARRLQCPELAAMVLEMRDWDCVLDPDGIRRWMNPCFEDLMEGLSLGAASAAAAALWRSKSSFGNVLVYGDYDTDGISATVLAMEIFRHKASGVRYFIPRRDVHGYGLHAPVL